MTAEEHTPTPDVTVEEEFPAPKADEDEAPRSPRHRSLLVPESPLATLCQVLFKLQHTKGPDIEIEWRFGKQNTGRERRRLIFLGFREPSVECTHTITTKEIVQILKEIYPNYNYPKSFKECNDTWKVSSEKLQRLGWKYRPLKDTLVDSVENYEQNGLLGL